MMRSVALPVVVAEILMPLGQVARLPCARAGSDLEIAAVAVATLARNHVQPDAAGRRFGADAGGLIAHLLVHRVVEVALDAAIELKPVHHHPVPEHGVVGQRHPARRHVGLLHGPSAARIWQVHADTHDELSHPLDTAPGGNPVDRVPVEYSGVHGRGCVDHGRFARDGHRLLERADTEFAFTVAVNSEGSSSPSRRNVLKPVSAKVTV